MPPATEAQQEAVESGGEAVPNPDPNGAPAVAAALPPVHNLNFLSV